MGLCITAGGRVMSPKVLQTEEACSHKCSLRKSHALISVTTKKPCFRKCSWRKSHYLLSVAGGRVIHL
jgi:hypothetical protein